MENSQTLAHIINFKFPGQVVVMRASDGHHKGSAERTLHLWPAQLLSIVGIAGIIEIIGRRVGDGRPVQRGPQLGVSGESKTISEPCRLSRPA